MPRTLNTKVTQLRRAAPGSLRQEDVALYMRRKRHPIQTITVSDFERGKYLPADPFLSLYAECTGHPVSVVRDAFAATQKAARPRPPKAAKPRRRG